MAGHKLERRLAVRHIVRKFFFPTGVSLFVFSFVFFVSDNILLVECFFRSGLLKCCFFHG